MIFLGQASNYRGRTWHHFFARGHANDSRALRVALAEKYGAPLKRAEERVYLYHTGRSALAAAFKAVLPAGGPIIIPGLTCIAVVRAVKAAASQPVYVDIDPATLQYDFDQLESTLKRLVSSSKTTPAAPPGSKSTPVRPLMLDIKEEVCYNGIIVAQNTLGLPLEMSILERLAQKYHFAIVEDLAHSAGRFYPDGREVGTVGLATALSFGKGKAIDTIEGGAVIFRAAGLKTPVAPTRLPRRTDRWRDRWYPVLAGLSRGLARLKLDKIWLGFCLKLHFIQRSADARLDLKTRLPDWQAKLALEQLTQLPATPLREHLFVENRAGLLRDLRAQGFYLDEIWYDTPVAPARYHREAAFPAKTCPRTVRIAREIVNLPTWYSEKELAPARQIIADHQAAVTRHQVAAQHQTAAQPEATADQERHVH